MEPEANPHLNQTDNQPDAIAPPSDTSATPAPDEQIDERTKEQQAQVEELRRRHEALIGDGHISLTGSRDWSESLFLIAKRQRHYFGFVLWLLLLALGTIVWQTNFENKLRSIDRLERQVEDIRYRHLFISAELVRIQRISSIEESIRALGLDLEHSTVPPYEIVTEPAQ